MKKMIVRLITASAICVMLLTTTAFPQNRQRINFKRGTTSATVSGTVAKGGPDRWTFNAKKGQKLTVTIRGKVTYGMDSPRMQMTEDDSNSGTQTFDLDFNGDYSIRVYSMTGTQKYSITVRIR